MIVRISVRRIISAVVSVQKRLPYLHIDNNNKVMNLDPTIIYPKDILNMYEVMP